MLGAADWYHGPEMRHLLLALGQRANARSHVSNRVPETRWGTGSHRG